MSQGKFLADAGKIFVAFRRMRGNSWYVLTDSRCSQSGVLTPEWVFGEFADCLAWWNKRKRNDRAWKVSAKELLAAGCNLDRKNPSAKEDIAHLPPEQLAASILAKEQRIAEIMGNIRKLLAK